MLERETYLAFLSHGRWPSLRASELPSLQADWRLLRPFARGGRLPGPERTRDEDVLFGTKTKRQS
jgi:hypothetical protein